MIRTIAFGLMLIWFGISQLFWFIHENKVLIGFLGGVMFTGGIFLIYIAYKNRKKKKQTWQPYYWR